MTEHPSFPGWGQLRINDTIIHGFDSESIHTPTQIQAEAIPSILQGRSTVIHSATGTGKTLAYLLPLLQRMTEPSCGRALIMAPGTELVMQIAQVARLFKDEALSVGCAVASVSHGRQRQNIQKSTKLIVGTPGRVHELYQSKKLKKVGMIVLDEPEPILNSKGGEFLFTLLRQPEPKVQLILAGATLGPTTQKLVAQFMGEQSALAKGTQEPLQQDVTHTFIGVQDTTGKEVALARFIQKHKCKQAIVFVNRDNLISHLYRYLNEHGHKTLTLSRERSPRERKEAMEKMRSSEVKVLVVADAAARGLDFTDVQWVFHYDLPSSAQAYLHRAGRTGRGGQKGTSVALLTDKTRALFKRFTKELNIRCKPFSA
jgi:ATP-dependent RNA helicase DeaD